MYIRFYAQGMGKIKLQNHVMKITLPPRTP